MTYRLFPCLTFASSTLHMDIQVALTTQRHGRAHGSLQILMTYSAQMNGFGPTQLTRYGAQSVPFHLHHPDQVSGRSVPMLLPHTKSLHATYLIMKSSTIISPWSVFARSMRSDFLKEDSTCSRTYAFVSMIKTDILSPRTGLQHASACILLPSSVNRLSVTRLKVTLLVKVSRRIIFT